MTKSFVTKKKAPKIGRVTSAMVNFSVKDLFCRHNLISLFPQVLICDPLAADRFNVACLFLSSGEAGNTEMSAPASTRYGLPLRVSARVYVAVVRDDDEKTNSEGNGDGELSCERAGR